MKRCCPFTTPPPCSEGGGGDAGSFLTEHALLAFTYIARPFLDLKDRHALSIASGRDVYNLYSRVDLSLRLMRQTSSMVSEGSISRDTQVKIVCASAATHVAYECVRYLWFRDHSATETLPRRCNSFHFIGPAVQSGNRMVLQFLLQKFRERSEIVWTSTYVRVLRGLIHNGHTDLALSVFNNGDKNAWWSPASFDLLRTQSVIYACWTEAVIAMNMVLCMAFLEAVPEERRARIMAEKPLEIAMNANRKDVFEYFWNMIPATNNMRINAGKAIFRQVCRNIMLVRTTGALINIPSLEMRKLLVSKIEHRWRDNNNDAENV
jgi:hypothetical protein